MDSLALGVQVNRKAEWFYACHVTTLSRQAMSVT